VLQERSLHLRRKSLAALSVVDSHSATIVYVRSLVPVLEAAGLPRGRFLQRLGLDEALLGDVDARIPREVVSRAWRIAAEVTGNEHLGLEAALLAPLGVFPILDHIASNQPTVGDALRSIARY
jgi:hypothetical protein